ncbi:MAG: tRNA epoxyqueuosine(34) reductase QueG [Myxococcota bacterium]
MLTAARLTQLAKAAGFELVGFSRAAPIPREVLADWLAAGHHADLDWMAERLEERLDVTKLFPGAKTVVSLVCNYWHTDDASPIARYARGRDYHATMRDRLRTLRRTLRAEFPGVADYGAVDANPVMEKVWAVRAGLGTVTKNGCFTTHEFGSWVVLATMILDAEVDAYASPLDEDPCGRCRICLDACPTSAIVDARVVDARACLSYQTIENDGAVPEALRPALTGFIFGCDICQDVCPLNVTPVKAGPRFEPRLVARQSVRALAAMTKAEFDAWVPGSALARAGFDGLRRNAAYALGAMRDVGARELLETLTRDASERVREAAAWALTQL